MNIATFICLQALIVASTVLYGIFRQDYDEIKMGVLQNRVAHLSAVILAIFAYYIGAPLEAVLVIYVINALLAVGYNSLWQRLIRKDEGEEK